MNRCVQHGGRAACDGEKRDRRVQRTADLSEDEIAAVERSEMVPGYEHLDAELDPHAAD